MLVGLANNPLVNYWELPRYRRGFYFKEDRVSVSGSKPTSLMEDGATLADTYDTAKIIDLLTKKDFTGELEGYMEGLYCPQDHVRGLLLNKHDYYERGTAAAETAEELLKRLDVNLPRQSGVK